MPAEGEHYAWCSACKDAIYCSKECQKRAWKAHKPHCLASQASTEMRKMNKQRGAAPISSDLPKASKRKSILGDFIEAHAWSFGRQAVYSAMHVRGGLAEERRFDFLKEFMVYNVTYRADHGGNTALAFRVLDGGFEPTVELLRDPFLQSTWEYSRETRERAEVLHRLVDPTFLGMMIILFRADDFQYWYPQPWFSIPDDAVETAKKIDHRGWLGSLQKTVEAGYVLREVGWSRGWRLGRLKRSGQHWKWEQIPPEELVQMGYPADYATIL
ncbi:hypothetical protein OBBRIDRAFT_793085 [Obba rivulosa]|uniref:MYND-type domain-containing protein n=1 Tax=Obba rivulosa TaxID=1052685 RepID=A0A8E2B3H1_9APHY|nr:hypothetical protein OBBRIDRAFT_793085 [Obba rivulosa]